MVKKNKKPDKKIFDKEKMYSKIMPSVVTPTVTPPPNQSSSEEGADEENVSLANQKYVLRNFIEDIVIGKLAHTINMLRGCDCERCMKDVMALALNAIPSAYNVIEAKQVEENLKTFRANYEVKVTTALIRAVQTVKAKPKH